ncbi:hypothetical protein L1987_76668 [Smallanthus sonchifolius]|uniref:Uncharacterized protein n=1 Tax=Smallanthus sonchifolius TaxID=185202 RepID=A0ACB8Z831_9ASTR|nr:hypothetical protein L1987_76668 [Smallanthus sonchifolius]
MNSLSLTPISSTCNSCSLPQLKPLYTLHHHSHKNVNQKRRIRNGRCKAALLHEAPFAAAIGACVLNSVVFPLPTSPNDNEDSSSMIDSADARFAVMGIISFIPYFNWMSWVFAWMDTGDKRYAVYSIVYLAPYLRSNLSLSPDESWLPIASILLCILHIQLEASIKNGDFQNLPLLKGKKDARISEQETRKDEQSLPSANDEPRNRIRDWGIPKKPTQQVDHLDEEEEEEEGKR